MNTPFAILRVEKLTTYGNIAGAGQHCWRERDTPNAIPARRHLNRDLRDVQSADALRAAVAERVALAEHKSERPVLALEYFIGVSPEWMEGKTREQADAYLLDAMRWLEERHGAANVVAANIQHDEKTPHLQAFVVPLVQTQERTRKRSVIVGTNPDGTKRRETREFKEAGTCKLSAAHFVDGPAKLSQMQTDFAERVGKKHALRRGIEGSRAKHESIRDYYKRVNAPHPAPPKVTLPEATMRDRIDPAAYGQRVAQAVWEQTLPVLKTLDAQAKEARKAKRRVRDLERVNEQQKERLTEAQEKLSQDNGKAALVNEVSALRSLLGNLSEAEFAELRQRQERQLCIESLNNQRYAGQITAEQAAETLIERGYAAHYVAQAGECDPIALAVKTAQQRAAGALVGLQQSEAVQPAQNAPQRRRGADSDNAPSL